MNHLTEIEGLKTGDVVLFSGQCLVANTIKLLSLSRWSHVGIIIIDPNYDYPLIYESTHDTSLHGLDLGKPNQGVQIVPYHERVKNYKGKVAIRKLEHVTLSDRDLRALNRLRRTLVGRPFERNMFDLIKSNYKLPFIRHRHDLSSIFCSELAGQVYIVLRLLPPDKPSSYYTPANFSSSRFKLLRGCLGRLIHIK